MLRSLGRDVAITAVIVGCSVLGDVAAQVALVLRIHEDGNSAWAMTALLLAGNLPAVLFARLAGELVDRYDSRALMVGCALVQALICLPLAVSTSMGVMVALVAGLATLTTVAGLARNALVPDMVTEQQLLHANAVLRAANAVGRMAGWPIGGFLTGLLGSDSVLLLDAVSFGTLAAGALVIHTRRVPKPARRPLRGDKVRAPAGMTIDPILPLIASSVGLILLFVSTTNVAQVFFLKDVLGASDTGYGVVSACWMVGSVLAVPIVAQSRCSRGTLVLMVIISEAATGVAVLGAGLASSPVVVGVWYMLGGLGSSSMLIAGATLRQLVAPREARGRVLAVYNTLVSAGVVVALGLSAVLMSWLGARGVFVVAGVLAVTAAMLTGGVVHVVPRQLLNPRGDQVVRSMTGSAGSWWHRTAAAEAAPRGRDEAIPRVCQPLTTE
ncbi:MAG: MFS transporter [Pseudonocardiales bacterium]|nr:MFS transporter [Pseudonocardiales bacterium]